MTFKRMILLGIISMSLTAQFVGVVISSVFASVLSPKTMMGEETIGNEPFRDANFKDWPNIMPVVNNKSRVYHTWVNGDERFYFDSDSDKLNELLIDFAKLQGKKEVLILPQADDVKTFHRKRSFKFNCQLHLVRGAAKYIAGKPKGSIYWPLDPRLTIHVTPKTDLTKLKIPKGIVLVSLAEIKERYQGGFESTDKTVRGWGIGFLANVDPYDGESIKVVSDLTVDKDDWVALNALSSLQKFGHKVKDHLPRLREIANSEIKNNADRAKKVIEATEAACKPDAVLEFEKKEKFFRQQADQAQAFIDGQD